MRRGLGLESAAVAPSLAAGVGLTRLTNAPWTPHSVVPVVICVVGGQFAAAAGRRIGRRLAPALSVLVGVVAVALASVWWFVPGATTGGLPTAETARALGRLLSAAFAVIDNSSTPVAARPGIVLCAAAGAGFLAVAARALLPASLDPTTPRRLGLGLLPSGGLFAYASLVTSDADRVQATLGYLGAVLLFVVVTDQASTRRGVVGSAGPRARRRPVTILAVSAVAVAGALAVPLAVSPALAGMRVHALAGSQAGAGAQGAGFEPPAVADDAVSLIDDLDGVPAASKQDVLFVATTPLPTYWQVATLSTFDGLSWDPDVATAVAASGVIPVPASPLPALLQPAGGPTLKASVTIEHLQGSLLPVPPGTVSASGRGMSLMVDVGLDQPAGPRPGTTYALVTKETSVPASAESQGPVATDKEELAPYLQLPSLPQEVVTLAHRIVAGDHSALAKATSLARFFDSGRFRYSLDAPAGGEQALARFLFKTRAGVCQQFAGAYGVLARIDGLPTRIAVGFNAGAEVADGVYQVTGADAHVWPEVYLGPSLGWISFEPTPLTSNTGVAAGVVYGSSHVPGSGAPAPGVFQNPRAARDRGVGASAGPTTTSVPAATTRLAAGVRGHSGGPTPLWPVAAGLVVLTAGLALERRQLRDLLDALRCRTASPSRAVVVRWEQAVRTLGRRHLDRSPSETMAEHAARVCSALGPAAPSGAGHGGHGKLAGPGAAFVELSSLASRVCYSDRPVSAADAEQARGLCAQVRSAVRGRLRR